MENQTTTQKASDLIKIKPSELEKIVISLYKEGKTLAQIGMILRDKYGIPKIKILGKKISQILKEANIPLTTEKNNIINKIEALKKHIEKNKHDIPAKRRLIKLSWLLQKFEKNN